MNAAAGSRRLESVDVQLALGNGAATVLHDA
jgi:hypothetical protein